MVDQFSALQLSPQGTHTIQKSHLNIRVRDSARAYEIQTQVIHLFQSQVVPLLEQELDRLVPADQVIYLDRLQLDLGNIALERMATDLPRLVGDKLREALPKAMASAAGTSSTAAVRRQSIPAAHLGALIQFLETGVTTWELDTRSASPAAWLQALLEEEPVLLAPALRQALHSPRVATRLCLQFPLPLQVEVLKLLLPPGPAQPSLQALEQMATLLALWAADVAMFPGAAHPRRAWLHAWAFQHPAQLAQGFSPIQLLGMAVRHAASTGRLSLPRLEAALGALDLPALQRLATLLGGEMPALLQRLWVEPPSAEVAAAMRTLLSDLLLDWAREDHWQEPTHASLQALVVTTLHIHSPATQQAVWIRLGPDWAPQEPPQPVERPVAPSPPHPRGPGQKSPSEPFPYPRAFTEALYVDSAGIVLLNPFFQPCFEDLGWMQHGEFMDQEAQENAVLFTAYLGCGEMEISEARLPLAKLLCGMDLHQPVRAQVSLPQRALDEVDTLLTAANDHWKKAGKLTPSQFREAFLLREGRLQETANGWSLKVDRHTLDILLEFLPWSFGTIKLPWMPAILTVDW